VIELLEVVDGLDNDADERATGDAGSVGDNQICNGATIHLLISHLCFFL
jgi:hypothetical protein